MDQAEQSFNYLVCFHMSVDFWCIVTYLKCGESTDDSVANASLCYNEIALL